MGGVLLIAGVVIIVFSVIVCVVRGKQRRSKEAGQNTGTSPDDSDVSTLNTASQREREFVLISTGTVISTENTLGTSISPAHTLQASTSNTPVPPLHGVLQTDSGKE